MVVLVSILTFGCKKEEEEKPVEARVSARFEYEQLQNAPCWVHFTNNSVNARYTMWDFGSGFDTYGTINYKKWYWNPGSYPVAIRAYGSNGDSSTYSKNITIK